LRTGFNRKITERNDQKIGQNKGKVNRIDDFGLLFEDHGTGPKAFHKEDADDDGSNRVSGDPESTIVVGMNSPPFGNAALPPSS
jgi:hypothetical protein